MSTTGKETSTGILYGRWDSDALLARMRLSKEEKMNASRGSFVMDTESFDAAFFGISLAEAKAIDPQQRALLECTFLAFNDAGYTMEGLRGLTFGVFVAVSGGGITPARGRDPIEIETLASAFATLMNNLRISSRSLMVGSAKNNIGYLEMAAGMTSLIMAISVVSHEGVFTNVGHMKINPRFEESNLSHEFSVELTMVFSSLSGDVMDRRDGATSSRCKLVW
eukprot:CAMPEP_0197233784 /NCGR_PEP_ID=MMETSP1429-20130617/1761_1 /TAXON_ID=49237 /ORGANISM="Chaetoceros  sp., Strain UNC1202" /LENGTH=222 /DNA_ID=CAMNT_0042692095 /DNA_START=154 /DNA_END=819 /DNA_ORIENTATION=+